MKKYRIKIKSSKRQWIYLIIELIALIVFPLIVLLINPTDTVCIITIIISFSVAITMLVLILKEDRKAYKKQKDLLIKQTKARIIHSFINSNISYDKSFSEEQTKNYIICTLLKAAEIKDLTYFYMYTSDFKIEDITNILLSFDITDDFKDFIINVISKYGVTQSIKKYESEIIDIIMVLSKIQKQRDSKFFDKEIYYDKSKIVRFYIKYNEKIKKYDSFTEIYRDYIWSGRVAGEKYETKEEAVKQIEVGLDAINQLTYDEECDKITFSPDSEIKWYKLLYLYSKGDERLDKDYYNLMDYYVMVSGDGHKTYTQFKDITRYKYMDIVLPQKLYEDIKNIQLKTGENLDKTLTNLDKCFEENSEVVRNNIIKFVKIDE